MSGQDNSEYNIPNMHIQLRHICMLTTKHNRKNIRKRGDKSVRLDAITIQGYVTRIHVNLLHPNKTFGIW